MAAIELASTPLFSDANLQVYYRLEDTADSGPNGYTLTNNGTTPFNASQFNNGGDFGASNSTKYFTRATAIIDPRSDYTISFWVKLQTEIGSGVYEFLHLENNTAKHTIYLKYDYNAGTRRLDFQQDRWVIAGANARYTVTLGTTNYYHLILQKSGTTLQLFLNGSAVGTTGTTDNATGDTTTNNQLIIGAGSTVGTGTIVNYASAIVDDVAIFNRVLTSTEIGNLYNGTFGSASASVSASQSPSASVSPSASESLSISASLSPSSSISPSESSSLSPSLSLSPSPSGSSSVSPSSSLSPSASTSRSQSPSSSPSQGYSNYTRGDYLVLPTNDDDLETIYTELEEDKVSESDNVYVGQTATQEYMLHEFKVFVGSQTSCKVIWEGQSTLAPSVSPVYLQIYNQTTSTWYNVDSNNTLPDDTNFELSGEVLSLSSYKTSSDTISCRVYQLAI